MALLDIAYVGRLLVWQVVLIGHDLTTVHVLTIGSGSVCLWKRGTLMPDFASKLSMYGADGAPADSRFGCIGWARPAKQWYQHFGKGWLSVRAPCLPFPNPPRPANSPQPPRS